MTNTQKNILILGGTILAIIFFPLISAYIKYNWVLPPDFFNFPPVWSDFDKKAPFNLTVFIIITLGVLAITLFYLFPYWFGFKKVVSEKVIATTPKLKFPVWFWIGIVFFAEALIVMWGKFQTPAILVNWSLIPLFWGFILILDGFVYKRNNGHSLINDRPKTMIAISVCSIGGWVLYEYLNFFVKENWYYPASVRISTEQFMIYSLIGSSALLTVTFEWYTLFNTFKGLKLRYTQGPKINISKKLWTIILITSLVLIFFTSMMPNALFFMIWLGPMFAIISALEIIGVWTPFTSIKEKGNWGPILLICLSYFVQGLCFECWNYFSGFHTPEGVITYNPGYWIYSVPYVNVLHVFEMPLLGLFGYLPFGLYAWVFWLAYAYLTDTDPANLDMNTL